MENTCRNSVRACQKGITIPEILLSLILLAIGLSGVLAAFPLGMKFATEIKENTISSIIYQNNASCFRFRGFYYGFDTTPESVLNYPQMREYYEKYFPPTFRESSFENFIPMNACDRDFCNSPFEIAVNPVFGTETILHDDTVSEPGWEVSIARRRSQSYYYSLTLMVIHNEGSERYHSFLLGKGYDFSMLVEEE